MNKKNIIKLATVGSLCALSIVGIAVVAHEYVVQKEDMSPEARLNKYHFWVNTNNEVFANNKQSKILASDFEYASYNIPYDSSNNLQDPNLKYSTEKDRGFWPYQLQLKSDAKDSEYQTTNRDPFFYLRTSNNAPIDLLKEKYNIYYQSYANDQEGILYLKVNLEKKDVDQNKPISQRKNFWIGHTYKITGFAKITQADLDKKSNYTPWSFSSTSKLNNDFSNETIASVQDFLNMLPQSSLDSNTQKNEISENNAKIKSYLLFNRKNNSLRPFYQLDDNKSIWFDNAIKNGDELTINYYISKLVPVAIPEDLGKVTLMPVTEPVSQNIKINFNELKEAAKNVEIVPFNNADLKTFIPYGKNFTFFNPPAPEGSKLTNTEAGFYQNINLQFKDNFTDKNQYELKYYPSYSDKENIEGYENNGPLVSYDKTTGSAKFAYILTLKANSPANGIMKYIGVFEMPNAFKSTN